VKRAAALGVALVAAHAAAFVALAAHPAPPFEVRVSSPVASARFNLDGDLAAELRARVHRVDDGLPPAAAGLRRVRWRAEYRGGFARMVGATQLAGPSQDPDAPPCSGRVVIGQRLLDDGAAGPGTIAQLLRRLLEQELRGQGRFPVGDFRGIPRLALTWSRLEAHDDDRDMFGEAGAPRGYLRAAAVIAFDRVEVPVVIGLVPQLEGDRLGVRVAARASLTFDNRVAQWLSDLAGGDRLASALARQQLAAVLRSTLEPPPPLSLPGGGSLRFVPCGEEPEIFDGSHGALAFAVAIDRLPGYPQHLPPSFPTGPVLGAPSLAPIALDLDVNALNALLYGAWRDGLLDRQLASAGIAARFNRDPTVATYLSVRIDPPRLTLPPVLTPSANGLRLAAEAAVQLSDGTARTLGRVWTAMELSVRSPADRGAHPAVWRAALRDFELTCEPRAHVLAPCYADLVEAMRTRTDEFNDVLSAALSEMVTGIFVDRALGAADVPAELILRTVTPSLVHRADGATLRLELAAELHPAR
jgi:hypothetical protein